MLWLNNSPPTVKTLKKIQNPLFFFPLNFLLMYFDIALWRSSFFSNNDCELSSLWTVSSPQDYLDMTPSLYFIGLMLYIYFFKEQN